MTPPFKRKDGLETPVYIKAVATAFLVILLFTGVPLLLNLQRHYVEIGQDAAFHNQLLVVMGFALLTGMFGFVAWRLRYFSNELDTEAKASQLKDEQSYQQNELLKTVLSSHSSTKNELTYLLKETSRLATADVAGVWEFIAPQKLQNCVTWVTAEERSVNDKVMLSVDTDFLEKLSTVKLLRKENLTVSMQKLIANFSGRQVEDWAAKVIYTDEQQPIALLWTAKQEGYYFTERETSFVEFAALLYRQLYQADAQQQERKRLRLIEKEYQDFVKKKPSAIGKFLLNQPLALNTDVGQRGSFLSSHHELNSCNPAFRLLFGIGSKADIGGYALQDFFEKNEEWLIRKFIRQDYRIEAQEISYVHQENGLRYLLIAMQGILENGKLIGFWLNAVDITPLKMSEIYYRQLSQHSLTQLTLLDQEGTIVFDNAAVKEKLGYEVETRFQKPIFSYVHPDDLDDLEDYFSWVKERNLPYYFDQLRFRHAEGTWVSLPGVIGPTGANEHLLPGFLLELFENPEQRKKERELEQKKDFFQTLTESWSDVYTIMDTQGVITYESPAMEKEFGYPLAMRKGKYGLEYIHAEDVDEVEQLFQLSQKKADQVLTKKVRFMDMQGRWRNVRLSLHNLTGLDAIQGVAMKLEDIREEIEQQEAAFETFLPYRQIADLAPLAFLIINEKGTIAFANSGSTQLTGYGTEKLEGENFLSFLPREQQSNTLKKIQSLKGNNGKAFSLNAVVETASEQHRKVKVDGNALLENGKLHSVLLTLSDITEQSVKERELFERVNLFRALAENTPVILLTLAENGKVLYRNPSAQDHLGYALKGSIFDWLPSKNQPVFQKFLSNKAAKPLTLPTRLMDKDGNWQPFELHAFHLNKTTHRGESLALSFYPLRKKIVRESWFSAEMELFDLLRNHPSLAFLQVDGEGKISMANGQLWQFFAESKEQLVGMEATELFGVALWHGWLTQWETERKLQPDAIPLIFNEYQPAIGNVKAELTLSKFPGANRFTVLLQLKPTKETSFSFQSFAQLPIVFLSLEGELIYQNEAFNGLVNAGFGGLEILKHAASNELELQLEEKAWHAFSTEVNSGLSGKLWEFYPIKEKEIIKEISVAAPLEEMDAMKLTSEMKEVFDKEKQALEEQLTATYNESKESHALEKSELEKQLREAKELTLSLRKELSERKPEGEKSLPGFYNELDKLAFYGRISQQLIMAEEETLELMKAATSHIAEDFAKVKEVLVAYEKVEDVHAFQNIFRPLKKVKSKYKFEKLVARVETETQLLGEKSPAFFTKLEDLFHILNASNKVRKLSINKLLEILTKEVFGESNLSIEVHLAKKVYHQASRASLMRLLTNILLLCQKCVPGKGNLTIILAEKEEQKTVHFQLKAASEGFYFLEKVQAMNPDVQENMQEVDMLILSIVQTARQLKSVLTTHYNPQEGLSLDLQLAGQQGNAISSML